MVSAVSLNASELSSPTGPLSGAASGAGSSALSLIHRESLVAILVGHDAVAVTPAVDPIDNVDRYWTGHLGFVEKTIGDVIEEYAVVHADKEHVTFLELVSLPGPLSAEFTRVFAAFWKLLCLRRCSENSGAHQQHCSKDQPPQAPCGARRAP